jgi:hypothetical protein
MNKKKTEHCLHSKHEQYLDAFIRKYPTARGDAKFAIIGVDPTEYWVSEDPKNNTLKCCQMCSISEGIARSITRNISTS